MLFRINAAYLKTCRCLQRVQQQISIFTDTWIRNTTGGCIHRRNIFNWGENYPGLSWIIGVETSLPIPGNYHDICLLIISDRSGVTTSCSGEVQLCDPSPCDVISAWDALIRWNCLDDMKISMLQGSCWEFPMHELAQCSATFSRAQLVYGGIITLHADNAMDYRYCCSRSPINVVH